MNYSQSYLLPLHLVLSISCARIGNCMYPMLDCNRIIIIVYKCYMLV